MKSMPTYLEDIAARESAAAERAAMRKRIDAYEADRMNKAARRGRDLPGFEPMTHLEKRAAQYVDRIYGPPPAQYAKAIRDVKRMRADGVKPGVAMRKASEEHGHTREQLAQAILDMRGAR